MLDASEKTTDEPNVRQATSLTVHRNITAERNVLLIDDCTMTRECLLFTLQAKAENAFILLAAAQTAEFSGLVPPDVVLLNLRSSRVDDENVVNQIQDVQSAWSTAALAIISDLDEASLAITAMRLGCRAYLTSSMHSALVVAAINLMLEGGLFVPLSMIAHCLGTFPANSVRQEAAGSLTPKEQQIFGLLLQGLANKVIAANLGLSLPTVKFHVHSVLQKMGAKSRAQLLAQYATSRTGMEVRA